MRERLAQIRQEKVDLKDTLGINYDKINVKCKNNHQLRMHRGLIREYIGRQEQTCSKCSHRNLEMHHLFYRCEDCNYDMCRMCALQSCNPPILKAEMNFKFHNCALKVITHQNGSWKCDSMDLEGGGPCVSGIKDFNQAKFVPGFYCRACDFDICLPCALKYM